MKIKLFDSELKVMNILWQEGDKTAKEISQILEKEVEWNKNTTYTVIKKCIDKGVITRIEPNFMCHAVINKEEVQEYEVNELITKMFDGSMDLFFSALIERKDLPESVLNKLKQMIK